MFNVFCSLLHVFVFVCVRVLGAFLCVRAWLTGLRSGRICWQKCSLNFSRCLVCSFLFFRFLSFLFRLISCSFVFSRHLVLSVLGGSLLLLLLVHLRFLRAGGTAERLASLQRPRVFAQAARGPAACMCVCVCVRAIWSRWI